MEKPVGLESGPKAWERRWDFLESTSPWGSLQCLQEGKVLGDRMR